MKYLLFILLFACNKQIITEPDATCSKGVTVTQVKDVITITATLCQPLNHDYGYHVITVYGSKALGHYVRIRAGQLTGSMTAIVDRPLTRWYITGQGMHIGN